MTGIPRMKSMVVLRLVTALGNIFHFHLLPTWHPLIFQPISIISPTPTRTSLWNNLDSTIQQIPLADKRITAEYKYQ